MTMLTEQVLPETEFAPVPLPEVNPIDPRLPPEAPMAMAAQALHPEGEGFLAWLRGLFAPFGQAG